MTQIHQTPIALAPDAPKPFVRPPIPGMGRPPISRVVPGQGPGHWEAGGAWRPRRWVPDVAATDPGGPRPMGPSVGGPTPIQAAISGPRSAMPTIPVDTSQPVPFANDRGTAAPGGGFPGFNPSLPASGANGGFNYGDYNDPYNSYLSAIPVMTNQMNKQIGSAMATAGFGGNRWSTSAENAAGQIGADTSMKLNQMLNQTMFDQANRDQDRAMATIPLSLQADNQQQSNSLQNLMAMMGFGQYSQGRQDSFAKDSRDQFNTDRLGYLPYLIQAAMSQGTPSGGSPYQVTTNPGSQPTIPPELLAAFAGMFA